MWCEARGVAAVPVMQRPYLVGCHEVIGPCVVLGVYFLHSDHVQSPCNLRAFLASCY